MHHRQQQKLLICPSFRSIKSETWLVCCWKERTRTAFVLQSVNKTKLNGTKYTGFKQSLLNGYKSDKTWKTFTRKINYLYSQIRFVFFIVRPKNRFCKPSQNNVSITFFFFFISFFLFQNKCYKKAYNNLDNFIQNKFASQKTYSMGVIFLAFQIAFLYKAVSLKVDSSNVSLISLNRLRNKSVYSSLSF